MASRSNSGRAARDHGAGRVLARCHLGVAHVALGRVGRGHRAAARRTLAVNQRTNRLTWPLQVLAKPLVIVGALSPVLGGVGYVLSDHGAPAGSTSSPFTDAHVDSEQVDGTCPGITNWLLRGDGLGAREVHIGGDCSDFTFAAPDRLELHCFRTQGENDVDHVARTIVFDPSTVHIYSDTGDVQNC